MQKKCEKCGKPTNYFYKCLKCGKFACLYTACQKKQFGRIVGAGTCPLCGGRIVKEVVK